MYYLLIVQGGFTHPFVSVSTLTRFMRWLHYLWSQFFNNVSITKENNGYSLQDIGLFWFIVLSATFGNISVIVWQSVFFVKETEVPGENHPKTYVILSDLGYPILQCYIINSCLYVIILPIDFICCLFVCNYFK